MRTVEELETAGVAALTIEDTVLPRTFAAGREEQLISLEEGVGKMKAALAARQDPALVVIGRTSALRSSGVPETILRAKAYQQAGVDAIFLVGAQTKEEIQAVHAEVAIPLLLGGVGGELTDRHFLGVNGVRISLQGHLAFQAAVKAVHDTLKALRDGDSPASLSPMLASTELMARVTRQEDYSRWTAEFLG
jgi:carboxyvinyl-carboxyphosphonate phosphorylmutase